MSLYTDYILQPYDDMNLLNEYQAINRDRWYSNTWTKTGVSKRKKYELPNSLAFAERWRWTWVS